MTATTFALRRAPLSPWAYVALYAVLWGGSTGYLAFNGADWSFPLVAMAIFGLALSGLAWLLTRSARPQPARVDRPGVELAAVAAFLAVYAVGFLGYGMTALRAVFPPGREQELLVLAAKLAVHVAAPAMLLLLLGVKLAALFAPGVRGRAFWAPLLVLGVALIGLLAAVSPSLQQISALKPTLAVLAWAAPLSFVWIALEAGLCEEFLYRAVLQTRLAAVLRSEVGAVLIGALIFALAHAPGLLLRGGPGVDGWSTDPVQVIAFTIATLSPVSLLFGVLWSRTRSLLLVVLLHASIDVLPNLPEFLQHWAA